MSSSKAHAQPTAAATTTRRRARARALSLTLVTLVVLGYLFRPPRVHRPSFTPSEPTSLHVAPSDSLSQPVSSSETTDPSPLRAKPAGIDYARSLATPGWCHTLVSSPLKLLQTPECSTRSGSRRTDASNTQCGRFFSQYDQDIWIWLAVAQFLPTKGTYVDVGSNNPTLISNSYFFDRCLQWRGVCVEAQQKYHENIRQLRTCTLASCVSDQDEDVQFVMADDLGGIAETNKNVNGTYEWQEKARKAKTATVHCTPLKTVLERENVTEVTYMSLDVEGAELRVLHGIDWDKVHIWFITAEGATSNPAAQFLLDRGYKLVHRTGDGFFASPKAVRLVERLMGEGYLSNIVVPQ